MTALLEYPDPDCSIRVSRSFPANSVPIKWGGHGPPVSTAYAKAHVTSVNPSLRDECKLYQLLCCAITLYYSLILSCQTKWCVRILLAEVKILQGGSGTPPPYAPENSDFPIEVYCNTIIHLLFHYFYCIDPYFIFKLTFLKY